MERLLEAGARDVYYTPIFMKKNRPAVQLTVLCDKEQLPKLERVIFENTTTIGIRRVQLERTVLPREIHTISTSLGDAEIKICTLPNGTKRGYPEYESVSRIAREQGLSFQQVFFDVKTAAEKFIEKGK